MGQNNNIIRYQIETKSNCLIGSQNITFSIGGVDQSTTVDEKGRPIIHGSAIKGTLRSIARKEKDELSECKKLVEKILDKIAEKYKNLKEDVKEQEAVKNVMKLIAAKQNAAQAEDIFGIGGLSQMPALSFSDVKVIEEGIKDTSEYFQIDTKNTLEETGNNIVSKPRTYQVIKPEVVFQGNIVFKGFEEFEADIDSAKKEIESLLKKFNGDEYRIGNSKSRGYGKIEVTILLGGENE